MASSGAQISSGSKLEITQDLCQTATLCCSAGRSGAASSLFHPPTHLRSIRASIFFPTSTNPGSPQGLAPLSPPDPPPNGPGPFWRRICSDVTVSRARLSRRYGCRAMQMTYAAAETPAMKGGRGRGTAGLGRRRRSTALTLPPPLPVFASISASARANMIPTFSFCICNKLRVLRARNRASEETSTEKAALLVLRRKQRDFLSFADLPCAAPFLRLWCGVSSTPTKRMSHLPV